MHHEFRIGFTMSDLDPAHCSLSSKFQVVEPPACRNDVAKASSITVQACCIGHFCNHPSLLLGKTQLGNGLVNRYSHLLALAAQREFKHRILRYGYALRHGDRQVPLQLGSVAPRLSRGVRHSTVTSYDGVLPTSAEQFQEHHVVRQLHAVREIYSILTGRLLRDRATFFCSWKSIPKQWGCTQRESGIHLPRLLFVCSLNIREYRRVSSRLDMKVAYEELKLSYACASTNGSFVEYAWYAVHCSQNRCPDVSCLLSTCATRASLAKRNWRIARLLR